MTDTGILEDGGTMTTNLPVYTNDIKWRIEEFMSLPQKTGECITSKLIATFKRHSVGCPKFGNFYTCQCRQERCPEVLWKLQLYPRGHSAEDNEYVSILLSLQGTGVQNVSYKVTVEDSSLGTMYEKYGYSENLSRYGLWGWPKFVKRSTLEGKLRNLQNEVTIKLSIKHPGPASQDVISPPNNIDKKFLAMYKDQLETDTVIMVGKGGGIKVHKFVLIANSKVFEKILTSDCIEAKNNVINIKDIDREVCEIMLLFMYGEELPPAADLTIKTSEQLLYAAEKYELDELKARCEQMLSGKITAENVADILVTSDLYRAKKLKESCYRYIKANKKQVTETKKFQSVLLKNKKLLWEAFQA